MLRLVPLLALLLSPIAFADRGALTLEAGGGGSGLLVPAPWATPRKVTPSFAGLVVVGLRYAWSNNLELTLGGFFEPPVTDFHNDVTLVTDNGAFAGTLRHSLIRWGAQGGVRAVFGMVWRLVLGFEAGWSHRGYSGLQHIDVGSAEGPTDYGLELAAFDLENVLLAPSLGIEWAGGDHWAVSLVPRLQVLLGPEPTVAVLLPLTVSWSWYL
jgi:hypothetical protein